nr:HNH endonuclease family protein [Dermacoccus nishinomiyaensis]
MTTIDSVGDARDDDVLKVVQEKLNSVSASNDEFRGRPLGRIYEENTDVARFVLTTLAEDAMTNETKVDLWRQEKNHFVCTIEHILPQGENLPTALQEMLGGKEVAAQVQEEHRHRLGNLTITAYNSNLGNKSFVEKRDRQDSRGRYIDYRNGLSLNAELAVRESWAAGDIDERTNALANKVIARFPLA